LNAAATFALLFQREKTGSDQWLRQPGWHSARWPRIVPVVTDLVPAICSTVRPRENRRSVWRAVSPSRVRPGSGAGVAKEYSRKNLPRAALQVRCYFRQKNIPKFLQFLFSDPADARKFARAGRVLASHLTQRHVRKDDIRRQPSLMAPASSAELSAAQRASHRRDFASPLRLPGLRCDGTTVSVTCVLFLSVSRPSGVSTSTF